MPFKSKTNNFLIISVCNKHSEIGKVTFSNVALLIILRKQLKGNKHEKEKLIYALIVTLIIIIAIVSMIFFVQTKYGDQSEKGSQSVSNKIIKYISQLLTRINQRYITVKRLSWVKHLLKG